jgi:Uma2 family endonuclease
MASQPRHRYSVEEYLTLELSSPEKHEYCDGEIFAIVGASFPHGLIVGNLVRHIGQQLKGKPCTVLPSDLRVKASATGLYTYPDVVIICGTPKLEPPGDTLLNPIVLIEVLSPSTEDYDRGTKFEHFRTIESLKDYLLVAQDAIRVEHFARQPDDHWLASPAQRLTDELTIASIDCTLALAEIYDKVPLSAIR